MKFRQDVIKFAIGLFIGMNLFQFIFEGGISTNKLIGNAVGSIIGGLIYAYWTNRRNRHEIFRQK